MDLLAARDFATIEQITIGDSLSADLLRAAIDDYGAQPVAPPDEWWAEVSSEEVDDQDPPITYLAVPIWDRQEGRSDLTLELWAHQPRPQIFFFETLDLHVL